MKSPCNVVIVGGGFAGLSMVRKLTGNSRFRITLVDRNNFHFFPPLLYQVATAFIELSNISYPFRRLFQGKKNIRFHLGTLERVDLAGNSIITDTGTLSYDYLVLAQGTETNYFGMEGVRDCSLPMKTIDEALDLRNKLLLAMERAVRAGEQDPDGKLRTIVIAGGGPTGVELAGMLAEMNRHIAHKEYPEISNFKMKIFLIDAGPVLLSPMSKQSQDEACRVLKKLGVHIITGNAVKSYENEVVSLADGTTIKTTVLIWTSGVLARAVNGLPETVIGKGRRIKVNEINLVAGTSNVFALGDQCIQMTDKKYPEGHPQVAQVAIQQGNRLAHNLVRILDKKPPLAFAYRDKGTMAIISKYKAVADLPQVSFKGFAAWFVWLFIHIIPLIGFRNKLMLAFNWLWSFISNNPTLRLIVRRGREEERGNT